METLSGLITYSDGSTATIVFEPVKITVSVFGIEFLFGLITGVIIGLVFWMVAKGAGNT